MFKELGPQHVLLTVARELYSRQWGYVAQDRRRQFLFVGTNLRYLAEGIEVYANEEVARTSMYDSACLKSRRGYVGSFLFQRCERTQLPSLVHSLRSRHKHTIICAADPDAWRFGTMQETEKGDLEDVGALYIESDFDE